MAPFEKDQSALSLVEKAVGKTLRLVRSEIKEFARFGDTQAVLDANKDKIDSLVAFIQGRGPAPDFSRDKRLATRKSIYCHRYHIIQSDQKAQSRIRVALDAALKKLKSQFQKHDYCEVFLYKQLFSFSGFSRRGKSFYKVA